MDYPEIKKYCDEKQVTLVAVSKTKPAEEILTVYSMGQRIFGENKVQELLQKSDQLPKDIQWHLIGHLQSNKVKQVVPAVTMIHSVDSPNLLREVHLEAKKINRTIDVLLQIHIAQEETKFGLSTEEAKEIMNGQLENLTSINIRGLMGIASFTTNEEQVRNEFRSLKTFFDQMKNQKRNLDFSILSMGMSGDYKIAIEEGSNMVRIGSAIFGSR